jgi:hypothetical protein
LLRELVILFLVDAASVVSSVYGGDSGLLLDIRDAAVLLEDHLRLLLLLDGLLQVSSSFLVYILVHLCLAVKLLEIVFINLVEAFNSWQLDVQVPHLLEAGTAIVETLVVY